ncbi:MAG TPA: flagellar FlbD family protein [Clostridiales bacterium]|nr:flagellar FlbD family protein [Clostridiales bacterium]
MIALIDINGRPFYLNCNMIETLESIPETKVSLTNGKYFLVSNSCEDIIEKVILYNRMVFGAEKQLNIKIGDQDQSAKDECLLSEKKRGVE